MRSTIDSIREVVLKHYAESDEVLLLAELGKMLRENGAWPPPDDTRPLSQVIAEMAPEVALSRDQDTPAYVAVVPEGKEHLVTRAIDRRRNAQLLSELPRPIRLAFCLKLAEDVQVYVRTSPPFRYHVGPPPEADGLIPVEAEYRLPGLYVADPHTLSPQDAANLVARIKDWSRRHNIAIQKFVEQDKTAAPHSAAGTRRLKKGENALERLYAAQPESVAERIVIPFDIAVYLSRLP